MVVSCLCPKLIAKGKSAEQPSPARAKARIPVNELVFGTQALSMKAADTKNGRTRATNCSESHFSMKAKRTRPTVTMLQNKVRPSDAITVLAPKCSSREFTTPVAESSAKPEIDHPINARNATERDLADRFMTN